MQYTAGCTERQKHPICEAELPKLCINDQHIVLRVVRLLRRCVERSTCSKVTHNSLHVARAVTTEANFSPYVFHVAICYTEKGNHENSIMFCSPSVLSFKHCLDLNL